MTSFCIFLFVSDVISNNLIGLIQKDENKFEKVQKPSNKDFSGFIRTIYLYKHLFLIYITNNLEFLILPLSN